jgi:putative peptidoglycan lipid II flippase
VSIVAVSGSRIISQGLTVVLGILSAAYFGAGLEKDAYVVAQTIPNLLSATLIGGLYSMLIVRLAEVYEGGSGQRRMVLRALGQAALVLLPLVALTAAVPQIFLRLVAPGFGAEQVALSGHLLVIAMFTAGATVSFHVIRALHNAHHEFILPGLATVLGGVLCLVTLMALVGRLGIYALALGPLVGTALGAAALWLATRRYVALAPSAPADTTMAPPQAASVWRGFFSMSIGSNFGQVNLLVDNAFASFLPVGSITRLGFASVITSNAELITIFSLAEVALPRFTAATRRGLAAFNGELRAQMRYMLLVTAPIATGCLTFGEPIVRLLFERGAFGADSTPLVARTLACFAPEILFMGYFAVFWRALVALGRTRAILWTSIGAMALNALLDAVLMGPLGTAGIALATSGVTTAFALLLGFLLRRRGCIVLPGSELPFIFKVAGSALVMGIGVHGWRLLVEGTLDITLESARMLEVAGGLAVAAGIYATCLHLLRVAELADLLGRLTRLVPGRGRA